MQDIGEPLVSRIPSKTLFFRRTFDFSLGSMDLEPEYWQAIVIVFLIFLIVLTIARWRHLYVKWNMSSFLPNIMLGFFLALILEGFLLLGGRTLFTELLGWENAPKPISTFLDLGKDKLVEVLGVSEDVSIPSAVADEAPTVQSVMFDYDFLTSEDADEVKEMICEPRE